MLYKRISFLFIVAADDALKPNLNPIVVNLKRFEAVKVPTAQLLLQNMINVEDVTKLKEPIRDAVAIRKHLTSGNRLIQHVVGEVVLQYIDFDVNCLLHQTYCIFTIKKCFGCVFE